jgi:hypothetical protein
MLPSEDTVGFIDAVDWESIKKQGKEAIERWIAKQLIGTSVTVVLIGAETASREWVQHEIIESWNRGNGVAGVWIHNVKDSEKKTDMVGANPFESFTLPNGMSLSSGCRAYDWVNDNGRDNLGAWADEAAKIRAGYAADDHIVLVKKSDVVEKVAMAAGAVALGALAAAVLGKKLDPPAQPRSSSFTPRAPWCPKNDLK